MLKNKKNNLTKIMRFLHQAKNFSNYPRIRVIFTLGIHLNSGSPTFKLHFFFNLNERVPDTVLFPR